MLRVKFFFLHTGNTFLYCFYNINLFQTTYELKHLYNSFSFLLLESALIPCIYFVKLPSSPDSPRSLLPL